MRRVVFGTQAQRDLDEIWSFVARDSIDAAETVVAAVERALRQLSDMPGRGHERLELRGRRYRVWSRVWSVYSYLIIYRFSPRLLTVVRVVHGRRDLRRLFRPG